MKKHILLCCLFFSIPVTSAWAESTLKIGVQEDPDFLDPHRARSFASRVVFPSLCDSLLGVSSELHLVPRLATSWSWSADNKTLTLKLRPGVTFHDGEPFNAEAVKFNLERARTLPELAAEERDQLHRRGGSRRSADRQYRAEAAGRRSTCAVSRPLRHDAFAEGGGRGCGEPSRLLGAV